MSDTRTAAERQAAQAKKLTDEERAAADKEAHKAKRDALRKHADRLKMESATKKFQAEWLYVGRQHVEIVRDAEETDLGYVDDEAQSVVRVVDTGIERVSS
jgi:hypothetical protein